MILFCRQIRTGELCAVLWPCDGLFYRAVILDTLQKEDGLKHATLDLFDFGTVCCTCHVDRDQVYQLVPHLSPRAADLPPLALPARLDEVGPLEGDNWTVESTQAFKTLVVGDRKAKDVSAKLVKLEEDGTAVVRLRVVEEGQVIDVAAALESRGLVLMKSAQKSVSYLSRRSD